MKHTDLLVFIKPYKGLMAASVATLLIFSFLGMPIPWIIKVIIDRALGPGEMGYLCFLLVMIAVVFSLFCIFMHISHYITFYAAQRILFDLRTRLFKHLQSLSLRFYHEYRTGKLISNIITDVACLQQMVSAAFVTLTVNVFKIVCILTAFLLLSPKTAVFCFLLFPIYYINFTYFKKKITDDSKTLRERMSEISANLSEVLNGVKVVKSFSKEKTESREFVSSLRPAFNMTIAINMKGVLCAIATEMISMCCFLIALGYGGVQVMRGEMTVGTFFAFYSYLWMITGPLNAISGLSTVISEGITSGDRILGLLNTEPEIKEDERPVFMENIKGHISFENLSFGYTKNELTVKNFTLEVKPGRKVAFVGPSGSGKSTVASLLLRFYDASSGRICVDGVDIRKYALAGYRRNVGVVLQESFLFSGTIEENIRYGRDDATLEEVMEAAKRANAHEFIMETEKGYQTPTGENGVLLSGGQKQRLAIARAVLKDPKILILDEATSALDTMSEGVVQDALDSLMTGRTTIIIAHRLTTIQNADMIVVMKDGEIKQTGSHSKLMLEPGLYRELYTNQRKIEGGDDVRPSRDAA